MRIQPKHHYGVPAQHWCKSGAQAGLLPTMEEVSWPWRKAGGADSTLPHVCCISLRSSNSWSTFFHPVCPPCKHKDEKIPHLTGLLQPPLLGSWHHQEITILLSQEKRHPEGQRGDRQCQQLTYPKMPQSITKINTPELERLKAATCPGHQVLTAV